MRRILSVLLAACMLCVSAMSEEVPFPEPEERPNDMILGERIAARPDSIAMQYVSGDGSTFSMITRSILRSEGNTLLRNALETYFSSMTSLNRMSFIPEDLHVLSVDNVCGIVTVDLSMETWEIDNEIERFSLYASLINTLLSMDGVQGVNILVGGEAQQVQSLPLGVITQPYSGITPAYAQMTTEVEYFLKANTASIERNAVLYFPNSRGDCFLPEMRSIAFDAEDYTSVLLRALRAGSRDHETASNVFPEGVDLLSENPMVRITTTGERVLTLELSPALMDSSQEHTWELLGAMTLTITSFVPEIDAIEYMVNGEDLSDIEHAGIAFDHPDGLIRRSDFSGYIKDTVTLYLPTSDGLLSTAEKAISWERSDSPTGILRLLLEAIASDTFIHEIDASDLLGISVDSGVAVVNLSANFYRACQEFDVKSESALIYAMVNTLCDMSNIREVQFLIEGNAAGSLGGTLYLAGTLLPNPGIVTFPQITPIMEEDAQAE